MGCSRPGALAVACVTLAGVFASLSLFLPYWSKITLTGVPGADQLELTLGIWGSCLTIRVVPGNATGTDGAPSSRVRSTKVTTTSFTCASYFDAEVVGLRCTDLSSATDDGDYSCERVTNDSGESLCASDVPLALLFTSVNEIESSSGAAAEWRGVIKNACGGYGHASVALAFAIATLIGLAFVLLAAGITCGAIESCIARAGSAAAIATAILQSVLGLVWHLEARVATHAAYGTSYYMNVVSIVLLAIAFVAGRTHTQLGRDAQKMLEMDFVMDIGDEKPPLQSDDESPSSSKTAVGPLPNTALSETAAGVSAV